MSKSKKPSASSIHRRLAGASPASVAACRQLSRLRAAAGGVLFAWAAAACIGPHAHIPPRTPAPVIPASLVAPDSIRELATALAPVLYLQRDETFPLERVVAAVHPRGHVIAYYLLWRDDVHGAWIPFTVPTDEEVVWVGYDASNAPTDVWTYWHGHVLHTKWPRRQVEIDVQWGKHGSLPRGVRESDLPRMQTLNDFYAATIIGLPDIWLSDLNRPGPACFCHSYRRYRDFSRVLPLAGRLDAVVYGENPGAALKAVFGRKYSKKTSWYWGKRPPKWPEDSVQTVGHKAGQGADGP